MQIHGYILLGVAALEALIGRYVYIRDKKNPVNIAFTWLVLCILFWVSINAKLALTTGTDNIVWYQAAYLSGLLIGASLLNFVWVFPYRVFQVSKKAIIMLLAPLAPFLYLIFFTRDIISGVQYVGITARVEFGNGLILFLAVFVLYFLVSFYFLLKKYLRSDGIHQWQLKYVFISVLIPFLVNTIIDIILPLEHASRMPWMEYFGAESSLVWLGFTGYILFAK